MNRKIFFCLLLVALIAHQAFAQTALNTGSIYGKVLDGNHQPIPGVNVTLESEGMTAKTAFSGDAGAYRFTGLQPGVYAITFSMEGFAEVRQEDVTVSAGQNLDLEMVLSTTETTVVVHGDPVIDMRKTGANTAYTPDYLTHVPSARDPWVILDQTPGVEVDRINVGGNQSGQQSIFTSKGGSFTQNGWSYDGVDITDPAASGATPTYYDFDSFEEIQVTTGGQDPAISTGGVVINFVTKHGGNSWSGSTSGYFNNDSLQSNNVDKELLSQHLIEGNKADANWELGGDMGGPVVKDRSWAWGAYRYQHISNFTSKILVHDSGPNLDGTISGGARQFIQLTDINAKLNFSYNTKNEGSFQYLYGNKDFDHRFVYPPNQQSIESTFQQHGPSNMFKGEHTWIPNPAWFLDAKYGYVQNKFNLDPFSGIGLDAQPILRLNNDFFLENGNAFFHTERPQHNATIDANYFRQNWAGDHEFKFGFAYKHASVNSTSQYGGDLILYDYAGNRGDVSAGAGVAKIRYELNNQYNIDNLGIYGGDTWRMNRLTLNLGFHFDHNTSKSNPSDAPANGIAPDLLPALHWAGSDAIPGLNNLSPRVGATYDITGDGKTILRGNYARFYDQLGPAPASFINPLGGYTGVYTYYTDLNHDGTVTRDEIDTSFVAPFRGMTPGNGDATASGFSDHRFIDSNLKAPSTDEFIAGFERQLMTDVSVGATYTHRKYDNQWDTFIPGITSADFVCTPLTVSNPVTGETFTNPTYCDITADVAARDQYELLVAHGQTRSYDGVEFVLNKRMSDRWLARLSGTIQDQKIHYSDGSFQDPTNIAFTNDTWWAEQSTGSGSGGVFTGSRWSFKASGAYQFPHDITAGAYLKVIDGNAVPLIRRKTQLYSATQSGLPLSVLMAPFDTVRLETIKYMDLRIEKAFTLGTHGKLDLGLDVFNLFNTNAPLRLERRVNTFQFREPQEIVAPRILRLGVRYAF